MDFFSDPSATDFSSSAPTLTASTGQNDSSSVWGSGLLNFLTSATNTAGGVFTGLNQTAAQQAAAKQAANAKPVTSITWGKYVLIGVIVIALIIAAAIFLRRK